MYDYETKNESFVELAYTLKEEGVSNHSFFLLLIDEGLQGVDPYADDLSEELQLRILNECVNNFWYFIREIVRIPEPGGYTEYKINKLNLALSFCMELNLNIFVEGPKILSGSLNSNIKKKIG